jgi:hypothetical protein
MSRNFVIVDGLLTVEAILLPSYLVRRRIDDRSMKSPYVWVATIAQTMPEEYEVKGYLARDRHPMDLSDRRAFKRIVSQLGFTSGKYERVDERGESRAAHRFGLNGEIAQNIGKF